jgi:AraC-like DNA-binding protein
MGTPPAFSTRQAPIPAGAGDAERPRVHVVTVESAGVASPSMTPAWSGVGGRESTVSMVVVRGLVQAVEQAGFDPGAFLRTAGLEPIRLQSHEVRVPRSEIYRLCELAIDMTGDPGLGLHWAAKLSERMFVPVSHLITNGSSLRQCFELLAQFVRLLADDAGYQIVEEEQKVTLVSLPIDAESPRMQQFLAEMMLAGFWRLIRSFVPSAKPECASFRHRAPAHRAEYTRMFEGAELFEQPFTRLVFDRSLLDASSTLKDDDVREALQSVAERRLMRLTEGMPYALRVSEYLVREGWPDRTDMESAAAGLGTSARSLRRRLADEGKSYSDVLSDALATIAKTFLRGQRHTIQEVAYEMGFSDPSTFHRAFKRWTGTTPSAYRALSKHEGRK